MTTKIEPVARQHCASCAKHSQHNMGIYCSECPKLYSEAQLAAAVAEMQERCAEVCEAYSDSGFIFAKEIRSLKP